MLKWISISCAIIFAVIFFVLPLNDKNSKTTQLVSNIEQKVTNSLNSNEKVLTEEEKIVQDINTLEKTHTFLNEKEPNKLFVKNSNFKEYQLIQQEKDIEEQLKKNFAKLDAILKKENIKKNNQVKISEEEKQTYSKKINKLESELSQLTIENN